jgi:hypothetical protein
VLAAAQEADTNIAFRGGYDFGDVEPVVGRFRKGQVPGGWRPGRQVQALAKRTFHGGPRNAHLLGRLDDGLELDGSGPRMSLNLLGTCQDLTYLAVLESHA